MKLKMKRYACTFVALTTVALLSGCLPTHTIIVKFEDLKSDFLALENSLKQGEWAKFDWENMIITISKDGKFAEPYTLGAFETTDDAARTAVDDKASDDADKIDLDLRSLEMSDTIVQLMRRRQARYNDVMKLKRAALVGESNQGTLTPPPGKSLSELTEEQTEVVRKENTDRGTLFHEVLRQKKLGGDKLGAVAEKFAEVQRAMASRGFWVELRNGTWTQVE